MKDIENTKGIEDLMNEFYKKGFTITAIVYKEATEVGVTEIKTAIITEEDAKTFFSK